MTITGDIIEYHGRDGRGAEITICPDPLEQRSHYDLSIRERDELIYGNLLYLVDFLQPETVVTPCDARLLKEALDLFRINLADRQGKL